jgi:hypothetical protein
MMQDDIAPRLNTLYIVVIISVSFFCLYKYQNQNEVGAIFSNPQECFLVARKGGTTDFNLFEINRRGVRVLGTGINPWRRVIGNANRKSG